MKIAIVHPLFVVGGAERLLLDMADAFKAHPHVSEVAIFTTHLSLHHPRRDYDFVVTGDRWLPRRLFGRCQALCVALRLLYLSLWMLATVLLGQFKRYDVIVADQLAWHLPLLRLLCRGQLIYYCHFPDALQVAKPGRGRRLSVPKAQYRRLINFFDEFGLRWASQILVNSQFTAAAFKRLYGKARPALRVPTVLYPCVRSFPSPSATQTMPAALQHFMGDGQPVFLSLNRFEPQKDLHLAVESVAACHLPCKLIVAGAMGQEGSADYLKRLGVLCDRLDLPWKVLHRDRLALPGAADPKTRVLFLPDVSESAKLFLLKHSTCLIYTPSYEHFGIGVLEAMSAGLPVLCMRSGGPMETVVPGQCGYHCAPDYFDISDKMMRIIEAQPEALRKMGEAGIHRARTFFSFDKFSHQLFQVAFAP